MAWILSPFGSNSPGGTATANLVSVIACQACAMAPRRPKSDFFGHNEPAAPEYSARAHDENHNAARSCSMSLLWTMMLNQDPPSVDDLIRNKRASGRKKDLADVEAP